MTEETKTIRAKLVFHTTSGKVYESDVVDLDATEQEKWAELLRKPDEWVHFVMPQIHALGWTQQTFFNPKFIEAISVIIVPGKLS